MKKLYSITIILSLLSSSLVLAQNNNIAQPELDSGTIEEQFDYIITKSSKFREFQLIRLTSILKVKSHSLDSIRTARKDLIEVNQSTAKLESSIVQLKSEVEALNNEIEHISKNKDSILLFGSPLSKTNYNLLVWSIIVFLVFVLLFFIIGFKRSKVVATQAKEELNKVESEFESFRKKALKKEQETMRKLQDEINKNSL